MFALTVPHCIVCLRQKNRVSPTFVTGGRGKRFDFPTHCGNEILRFWKNLVKGGLNFMLQDNRGI